MWFLFLLSILNAALSHAGFLLKHRLKIGGLPLNALDATLILGPVAMAVGAVLNTARYRTAGPHPLLVWTLVVSMLAAAGGVIGGMMIGTPVYQFAVEVRNFLSMPLCILLGYWFLKMPASSGRFVWVYVVAGVAAAGLTLFAFLGRAAELESSQSIDTVRTMEYVSFYAGLAAAVLLFGLLTGNNIMPRWLTVVVGGFCVVGQFAPLTRSEWVACMGALACVILLLPHGRRLRGALGFVLLVPVLAGFLFGGVFLASHVTGRDVGTRMTKRIVSVLPGARGEDVVGRSKAWDTRLPGIIKEFNFWTKSPVIGQGFGYTVVRGYMSEDDGAFNHNVWTSSLATLGIFGFAAYLLPVLGSIVMGMRMVRDRVDRGSVLVGAIGFTAGVYALLIGAGTMSFNVQRGAMCFGLIFGVVMRARAMQLQLKQEWAGYLDAPDGGSSDPLLPADVAYAGEDGPSAY